jgi:hypothetical protein
MDQGWAALFGAIVGGGSIVAAEYFRHRYETKRLQRSLYAGIISEIRSIRDITNIRQYLPGLRTLAEYHRSLGDQQVGRCVEFVKITLNYFEVYQSNISALGVLKPSTTERVIKFYTFAKAIIEDLNNPLAARFPGITSAEYACSIDETASLMQQITDLADELIAEYEQWKK